MMIPKTKAVKNRDYLEWVAMLPCCVTGYSPPDGVQAHHMIGSNRQGVKVSDYFTIPLSSDLHDEIHGKEGVEAWEAKYGTQERFVIETLNQAFSEGIIK